MTTVGYGDVTPRTVLGRVIGGLTMVTGILMIALPVAIIGSSFAEVMRQRSFVVTFGLVARIPSLAGLPADVLGALLGVLRAMTVEAGTPVVGAPDDSLYIIATGVVEIRSEGGPRRLGTGDVFGTGVDYDGPGSRPAALAVTRVKLLLISRTDLLGLVARYPEIAPHLALSTGEAAPAAARRREV